MSWRVVIISSRSKLDYKINHLVVRNDDGEKRILLDDISVLICETTAISITVYLLAELIEHKIKVIFCDNQHNPISELLPYRGSYDTSGKLREQIAWSPEIKAIIWQKIIQAKITNQAKVLAKLDQPEKSQQLLEYAKQVEPNDPTNREGHAAKVYFNSLFDDNFYRNANGSRNAALNYGYTILLSCFNREIVASGYLTQLGIWHNSSENPFNLGSDLMESFRPIIDYHVATANLIDFGKDEKLAIANLLNSKVRIVNSTQYLNNAIGIYVRSIFTAISENKPNKILNWYEL